MKKILIPILLLLILPQVLAININVEKQSSNEVMISELDKPAVFDLKITNHGPSDNFEFYNLLSFSMFPVGTVAINEGATKGLLVTTADYGPDAYEFAKGKPLTLLNGSNLLHLLEKHGHHAKIDLKEAKKILSEREK